MHEASIAMSVLDTVIKECRQRGFTRIDSVRLRIGRASGVLPEALTFAFDIAKADTIAGEAQLLVDFVPLGGHCHDCRQDFDVEERFVLTCPYCQGGNFTLARGHELDIVEMEIN